MVIGVRLPPLALFLLSTCFWVHVSVLIVDCLIAEWLFHCLATVYLFCDHLLESMKLAHYLCKDLFDTYIQSAYEHDFYLKGH